MHELEDVSHQNDYLVIARSKSFMKYPVELLT